MLQQWQTINKQKNVSIPWEYQRQYIPTQQQCKQSPDGQFYIPTPPIDNKQQFEAVSILFADVL